VSDTDERQPSEAAPRTSTERPSEVASRLATRTPSRFDREVEVIIDDWYAKMRRQGGYGDYGPVPF